MEMRPSHRSPDRPAPTTNQIGRGVRAVAVPALWLGLLSLSGWVLVSAFFWLATIPPLPDCKKLPPLASDADRLYCAEQAARSGQEAALLSGFALVKDWPSAHPLHSRVNRAMKDWSRALLTLSRQKANKGDTEGAIALAHKIPASSPINKEVKTTIASWQKNQNRGSSFKKAFEAALSKQQWQVAYERLGDLDRVGDDPGLQAEVARLRQRLTHERTNWLRLEQAQTLVDNNPDSPEELLKAIEQADQVSVTSTTHPKASRAITRWSQAVLNGINVRLQRDDLEGAIALAQALPFATSVPNRLHDLVWYSRAQHLAKGSIPDAPLSQVVSQGWLALAEVRQVPPNSPFYARTQALLPRLEQQLQDLTQLQLASLVADLGQVGTWQLAVQMAQSIPPQRPQRLHAQTLIAGWQKDMQRAVDRPNLLRAQQLASQDSIPRLRAAIAQANQVAPGRALRPEVETAVRTWTAQIQTLEDKPFLDRAKALAQQKKFKEATQVAKKIGSKRALYSQAQASIANWTAQIQTAEDRPILNQAKDLAGKGDLSGAIETAAKIAPGRALYAEAQTAINQWSGQQAIARRRYRRSPRWDYDSPIANAPPPRYGYRPYRRSGLGTQPFPELPPP